MRHENARRVITLLGLTLFAGATAYGQNPFSRKEPVAVNYAHAYPSAPSPPGLPFRPVSYDTSSILAQSQEPGGRPLFAADFSQDVSLNTTLWSTDTPLLKRMAQSNGVLTSAAWVEPKIGFSRSGMTMSGVTAPYQFTGIQSNRSFAPPFTVQATVTGTIANGNPFEFQLVRGDLQEHLSLEGNLNKRNFGYYGMYLSWNGPVMDFFTHVNFYPTPDVNVWYTITVAVDAAGKASITLQDSTGAVLASRIDMNLGRGPFFLLLTQYEGLPNTVGPNSATWAWVKVSGYQPNPTLITSVSPILPQAEQEITIAGTGFGSMKPYNGDSAYIRIQDLTHGWSAGHTGDWLGLNVASWTDTKIVVQNFPPTLTSKLLFRGGDQIQAQVWNAQTGAGPATKALIVPDSLLVRITPVSGTYMLYNTDEIEKITRGIYAQLSATEGPPTWASVSVVAESSDSQSIAWVDALMKAIELGSQLPSYQELGLWGSGAVLGVSAVTPWSLPSILDVAQGAELTFAFGDATPQLSLLENYSCWATDMTNTSYVLQQPKYANYVAQGSAGAFLHNGQSLLITMGGLRIPAGSKIDLSPLSTEVYGYSGGYYHSFPVGTCTASNPSHGFLVSSYRIQDPVPTSSGFATTGACPEVSAKVVDGNEFLGLNPIATVPPPFTCPPSTSRPAGGALPTIYGISPAQGPAGTQVTISGSNFSGVQSATFGGVPAADYSVVSSNQIDATVPDIPSADTTMQSLARGCVSNMSVVVTTSAGSSGNSGEAPGNAVFDYGPNCTSAAAQASKPVVPQVPPAQGNQGAASAGSAASPFSSRKVSMSVNPTALAAGGHALISGAAREANGNPLAGATVELTASEGNTQAPPTSVTTGSDGTFRLPFTAPPTPGLVTIRARLAGVPNSPVATAILRVVPKR